MNITSTQLLYFTYLYYINFTYIVRLYEYSYRRSTRELQEEHARIEQELQHTIQKLDDEIIEKAIATKKVRMWTGLNVHVYDSKQTQY